uniref:Uncharacterized protein n=1 Tax=Arundo donax TaxID=35708 RepID=A0A0A9HY34_ARUDO
MWGEMLLQKTKATSIYKPNQSIRSIS